MREEFVDADKLSQRGKCHTARVAAGVAQPPCDNLSAMGDFELTISFILGLALYVASNVLYFRDGDKLVALSERSRKPLHIPMAGVREPTSKLM